MDSEYEIMLKNIGCDSTRHKKDSDSTRRPTRRVESASRPTDVPTDRLEEPGYDVDSDETTPVEAIEVRFTSRVPFAFEPQNDVREEEPESPLLRPPPRARKSRQTIAMSPWQDR